MVQNIGKLMHKVIQDTDYCLKSTTATEQINFTKNVIEYNENTKNIQIKGNKNNSNSISYGKVCESSIFPTKISR